MIRIIAFSIFFILLATLNSKPTNANEPNIADQLFSCTSVTEIPQSECEALVELYRSTDGPNWDDNAGWLANTTPCAWSRIICSNGHVTQLVLHGRNETSDIFGLKGNLPSQIGQLSNLTVLDLSWNELNSLPASIGNLTKLTHLAFDANLLSGAIPTEIGNLKNLTYLSLNANQLSGSIPTEIGNLTNLTYLSLNGNQLNGSIPTEINNLTNLMILSLYNNQLSGSIPTEIGNLTNLTYLSLKSNELSGSIPTEIGNLTNLGYLSLNANELSGSIPTKIGNLINLNYLSLNGNQLNGSIPTEIGNLINLTTLSLYNNQLSGFMPSTIGNLTKLTYLSLKSNQLSGSIPSEIGNLNNLASLHLHTNRLNNLPAEISSLNNVTTLSLFKNCLRITNPAVLQWANERDPDWASAQLLGTSKCESQPEPTPTRISTFTPRPTATSTSNSTTDLVADKIEVTQGIQDLSNSVRLVKDKRTYVRFHVHSNNGSLSTTAKLTVRRGNNQVELTPQNSGGQIRVRRSPNRGTMNHAFLFELPSGYRQGNVALTAILNPNGSPAESNSNNNRISVNVNFEPVPEQNLIIAAMGYGNNIYPSDFHQEKLETWLEKAYPVAGYNVDYQDYYYDNSSPPYSITCDRINTFLLTKRNLDVAAGSATVGTRYYGMVDDEGGFMRGCSMNIGGNVSSGPTGTGTWGWDTDGSYGDWYGGHELAHTHYRRHALFCGARDNTNPDYPNDNGWISRIRTGNDAIYGFDLDTHDIYGPDWHDLMTYCDNQWISQFTYEALMNHFQDSPVAAAAAMSNRVDRLSVVGTIESRTNDVRLEPISIIRNAMETKQRVPNGYAIVLRNDAGDELDRYGFTPDIIEFGRGLGNEGHEALLGINELVPYVDGTVRIDIEKLGQVIKTVEAGWALPSVTLDAASDTDGLMIDGDTIHLSWSGSDSDGDTISYLVQYSADNGQTWEVMTPYTTDTSARIHVSNIENLETALFRVVATDGINTTTSDISSTSQYFSSSTGGNTGTVRFADEDIMAFDPDSKAWMMYFDGSDVGLRNWDVDAFHILDDGNILLSLERPRTIGGVTYDDSDIIKFTATSLGNRTRGSFSMYLDGSDVGLTTNGEDIDAITRLANGDLVISTLGTARVTGAVARDEDMLRFHKTRLGNRTAGTWSLYLDGSDVQLGHKNEDIWATWVDENLGQVHVSTYKNYNAGGLRGDSDDILTCDGSVGSRTSCKLSLEWDGDAYSFGRELIDGYSVGPPPVLTVFSAAVDDELDAEDESLEIDDESEDVLDDDEYTEHLYLPLIER